MPCFGQNSLLNTFLSQSRMVKGVQEVYFGLGGILIRRDFDRRDFGRRDFGMEGF